jgi:5-methylcytosine-specific restriction endonuclease McrA
MQTQDVLARLKRATTDRVPTTDSEDSRHANGRLVVGDFCRNCGRDGLEAVVDRRHLLPAESREDHNEVTLCGDCHADVPTASDDATTNTSLDACTKQAVAIDADAVRDRDDYRCRGCGVRERIVVGSGLHVHPVVPIDANGYRHARNYVSLCPSCHRKAHDERA